jgi:tetrahydromethanopterin S-methyltransferase subunit D
VPRSSVAALTGLVAALLLPVSLLSVWVHDVVSDTDTYVETVTPLADDEVVKAAAVTELQREAMQLFGTTGAGLPAVQQLVRAAVERVVESPAFRTAWIQANRVAHDQVVAVLEGKGQANLDDRGLVTIDLEPVFHAVAQNLADAGVPGADRIASLHASIAVMDADQLARARRAYRVLDALGLWLPVAWAVLVALTLVLARRRLAATAKLAVASLLALGLFALALVAARYSVTKDLPQRDVARAVWDVVAASLWRQLEVAAIVLAIVAGVAAVLAALAGRGGTPSDPPDRVQQYG